MRDHAGDHPLMPIGYLLAVGIAALGMSLAVRPLGRSGWLGKVSWLVSAVPNESPFVSFYWVLAASILAFGQGDLDRTGAWAALAVAAVSLVGTPTIVARSLRARPEVDRALEEGLGRGWRASVDSTPENMSGRLPWVRILFAALPLFRGDVRRFRNIAYGDDRRNRLDLYRRRARFSDGPILIHLHGGYFRTGRKSFEARPLLHRLASRGWVCISANYRLRPSATFPDYLIDVKKVIRWAREHAHEHGADPTHVFVAGSSAGRTLPPLQPSRQTIPRSSRASKTPTRPSRPPSASTATTAPSTAPGNRSPRRPPSTPIRTRPHS